MIADDTKLATFAATREPNGVAIWQLRPTHQLVRFIPHASIERGQLELQATIKKFVDAHQSKETA